MQPKVGKLDIDYQVLHDAFFKHQTKPHLTRLGEIYYEGKEFEARVCHAVLCMLCYAVFACVTFFDGCQALSCQWEFKFELLLCDRTLCCALLSHATLVMSRAYCLNHNESSTTVHALLPQALARV